MRQMQAGSFFGEIHLLGARQFQIEGRRHEEVPEAQELLLPSDGRLQPKTPGQVRSPHSGFRLRDLQKIQLRMQKLKLWVFLEVPKSFEPDCVSQERENQRCSFSVFSSISLL